MKCEILTFTVLLSVFFLWGFLWLETGVEFENEVYSQELRRGAGFGTLFPIDADFLAIIDPKEIHITYA
jgi:hypothetical protein